ncbi:cyclin 5 [Trypanosoma conorhini]|uniref:Cyclin 5 n=1 Tax=Trypanosoma conorhini TaxID=83891 RepID=A0A422N6X0_9TRYP|nr:cyclin 5 [Trypanosoma conorhini]RNF01182.1 cyclin 5 [Trypanosoma conorhini]
MATAAAAAAATEAPMESTSPAAHLQRAKPRVPHPFSDPQAPPTAAAPAQRLSASNKMGDTCSSILLESVRRSSSAADADAWTAAGSVGVASHDWASSNSNVAKAQWAAPAAPRGGGEAAGGGQPSISMNWALFERKWSGWEGSSSATAERPGSDDGARAGAAKVLPIFPTQSDDARQKSHVGGGGAFAERNELHRQHQPCDLTAGHLNSYSNPSGQFQAAYVFPPKKTHSGNSLQHHGGVPRHHQTHQQQQHHHNCVHVVGAPRRCHRRRGFGAAAVEVIRNRTLKGTNSPQHNTLSPTLKGRKQQVRSCHVSEHEPHVGFPVPLPRSKLLLCGRELPATPVDGEAKTNFSASESELGSWMVGENTPTAFLLSAIAPFYDCAIQQLIIQCERRVANAPVVVNEIPCHQNTDTLQQQQLSSFFASIRSFDMQPSESFKPLSATPAKFSSPQLAFSMQSRRCSSEALQQQQQRSGLEELLGTSNDMDSTLDELHRRGGEGTQTEVAAGGGLFTLLSEERQEQETSPTMVQQLIESIGLHVAYGDAAPMALIGALVYMSRITLQCTSEHFGVTTANWYRLITIAILVATKMYVDGSRRWNERIANAAGLSLKEVNKLELDFLFLIDFALLIKEEEVEAWAEWMESVARRRGMSSQLRAFIFGRSSGPASTATTPVSSFAGEEVPPLSLSHMPATPMSLTPANMTPQTNAHLSPGAMQSAAGCSQRPSMSSVPELGEKCPQGNPQLHPSPSPLPACEAPSPFSPSPMHAPLDPRRTERLFSVVHAPEEPLTPPNLQQMSRLFDDAPTPMMWTPPEQETMSPIEFFKRSSRVECACNDDTTLERARHGMEGSQKSTDRNDTQQLEIDAFAREQTPPHHPMNVLSPPEGLGMSLLPPGVGYNGFINFNRSGSNKDIPSTDGATSPATVPHAAYPLHPTHDNTVRGHAANVPAFSYAEAQSKQGKLNTTVLSPQIHSCSKSGKLMHVISQVREVFGATRSVVRGTPLNVLSLDADCDGSTGIEERGPYKKDKEVDDYDVAECEEEDGHDEFEDDIEDDRENIFTRFHPVPTHSPPA